MKKNLKYRNLKFSLWFIAFLLFAHTSFDYYHALKSYRLTNNSISWPSTDVEIIRKKIWRKAGSSRKYGIIIEYIYVVDGVKYKNNRLSNNSKWNGSQFDFHLANEVYSKAVKAKQAFYDPQSPESSILIREPFSSSDYWVPLSIKLILSAVFLLLGLNIEKWAIKYNFK